MPVVLITGGARRLGRSMALGFARKGWQVGIIYNSSPEKAAATIDEINTIGAGCTSFRADVRSSAEINDAFSHVASKLGVPDLLINNAGVFPPPAKLEDVDDALWDSTMSINLRAYFYTARKYSAICTCGRIINIASLGAFETWKERIPYNVSKAGVIRLTEALARELAPRIQVNAVSPGTIEVPGEESSDAGIVPPSRVPMLRHGTTDDLFDAVYFFATCSKFITGQNLNVDGGYHLVK